MKVIYIIILKIGQQKNKGCTTIFIYGEAKIYIENIKIMVIKNEEKPQIS